jgi:RNA polymerase sigma factor (sigma-70 family)
VAPAPSSFSEANEALIVALARTGDQDAFAELVRRRQVWIRNLMRRCCGDVTLADDLAQQVFLQAWKDVRRLRNPRKFGPWLKKLAVNVWLQHLRKNDALHNTDEHDDSVSSVQNTPAVAMDLNRALDALSSPERLCIVLSYHEGMTHGEIAELTDFPLGTVKSHVRRGSQHLQQLLSAYAGNYGIEESQ